MSRHRFLNDGRTPIPMGGVAEYACVCGKRGAYAAIERHIAENSAGDKIARDAAAIAPYKQVVDVDNFGGDTMAHYLPNAPRRPAPTGESPPLQRPDRPATPEPLPSTATAADECPICGVGEPACDLPEIAAWSCGHWIRRRQQSVAEAFQDMLRSAYQAGALAEAGSETFESWYQREVLRS